MTATATRRPLADLLTELASGVGGEPAGVRPVSVEFDLPVETRIDAGADGPVVLVDVPRTRTRTAFDLPPGRLVVRLVAEVTP